MHDIALKIFIFKKPFFLLGDDLICVTDWTVFKNLPQEYLILENAMKFRHRDCRIWHPGWCNDPDSAVRERELRFPVVMGQSPSRKRSVVLDKQEATDRQLNCTITDAAFPFSWSTENPPLPHSTLASVNDRRPAGPRSECSTKEYGK